MEIGIDTTKAGLDETNYRWSKNLWSNIDETAGSPMFLIIKKY